MKVDEILIKSRDAKTGKEGWIKLSDIGIAIYESMATSDKNKKR